MQHTDMTGVLDLAGLHTTSHSGSISSGSLVSDITISAAAFTISPPTRFQTSASLVAAASAAIQSKAVTYHQSIAADIPHAYTFTLLPGAAPLLFRLDACQCQQNSRCVSVFHKMHVDSCLNFVQLLPLVMACHVLGYSYVTANGVSPNASLQIDLTLLQLGLTLCHVCWRMCHICRPDHHLLTVLMIHQTSMLDL